MVDTAPELKTSKSTGNRAARVLAATVLPLAGIGGGIIPPHHEVHAAPIQGIVRPVDRPAPLLHEQISTEEHRHQIENKYGIILDSNPDSRVVWVDQELDNLDIIMSNLPEHFHTPDADGRKVRIVIDGTSNHCCEYTDTTRSVHIVASSLTSARGGAHSLTHEIGGHMSTEVLDTSNPNQGATIQPINGDIINTVGESFQEIQNRVLPLVNEKINQISPYDTGRIEERDFYNIFKYSLNNPDEFTAVAIENYIEGPDYFKKMYGMFFSEDQVDQLYGLIRDRIFYGLEYQVPIYNLPVRDTSPTP